MLQASYTAQPDSTVSGCRHSKTPATPCLRSNGRAHAYDIYSSCTSAHAHAHVHVECTRTCTRTTTPQTAAALAWVSFHRGKPLAGLDWVDRCASESPTRRHLSSLDWQQHGESDDDGSEGTEVYNLSDDPEASRSAAHVAGAGGNVEAWTEFLGTWCVVTGLALVCGVGVYCFVWLSCVRVRVRVYPCTTRRKSHALAPNLLRMYTPRTKSLR